MKSIFLRQYKNPRGFWFSFFLICFSFLTLPSLVQFSVLFSIGLVLIAFNISYEIREDLIHKKHFRLFNFSLIKTKLILEFPDYISVFNLVQKSVNEYGPVSAIGTQSREGFFVIRFFKNNTYRTVFKTKKYNEVIAKSEALQKMLKVEVINSIN